MLHRSHDDEGQILCLDEKFCCSNLQAPADQGTKMLWVLSDSFHPFFSPCTVQSQNYMSQMIFPSLYSNFNTSHWTVDSSSALLNNSRLPYQDHTLPSCSLPWNFLDFSCFYIPHVSKAGHYSFLRLILPDFSFKSLPCS